MKKNKEAGIKPLCYQSSVQYIEICLYYFQYVVGFSTEFRVLSQPLLYALVHYLWLGRPSPIFVLD